jgi:2-polyprenyl-6-methoxyphenol hydroxylase-like FAD-dependent oxidoreductase
MNILIVGAGVAGLTLAYWLERQGHQPVILERAAHLRDNGLIIDFFGPGYAVAEKMNLLPYLISLQCPTERMAFVDATGHERFSISLAALRTSLIPRGISILHGDLVRLLYQAVKAHVPVQFGTSVASLEQDATGVGVTLTDGTSRVFDLVVGADGVHSHVRQLLFGNEEQFSRFLGCYTAAFVTRDLPLQHNTVYMLGVPGRQIMVYPIDEERFATLFAHQTSRQLETHSREAVERELEAISGHMGWIVPALLEQARRVDHIYFDTASQILLPHWSKGRVTLVGDACHCVSLVVARGASLAMGNAYRLAHELASATTAQVTEALARYEHRVKPGIERTQRLGQRQVWLFLPDTRLRLWMRDMFFRLLAWPAFGFFAKRSLDLSEGLKL